MPTPPKKSYDELFQKVNAIERRVFNLEKCQGQPPTMSISGSSSSTAAQAGENPSQVCDENSVVFRDLLSRLECVERLILDVQIMKKPSNGSGSTGEASTVAARMRQKRDSAHYATTDAFSDIDETTVAGLPMLNVTAHDRGAQDMIYNFSETIWDVMPFVGMGVLTATDVFCVVIIALMNVAIQGCFIGLVYTSMLQNDFSDDSIVTTFEKWRVLYAHNPDFADGFTDEPLAVSLCHRSFFMMQGASQASFYNDVDDYTKPFLTAPAGGIMCLLSMFLWILTCAKEAKRMGLFFCGIWTSNDDSQSLWRGPCEKSFVQVLEEPVTWLYGEARQKNYQIFLSPARALSVSLFVLLPRAAILMSLGIVGGFFLVQTVDLTELILNAVALDVVMNVDELVFEIFSPAAASRLVYKTLPLRVPRSKGAGKRIEPWIKLALASGCLAAVGWGLMAPMIKNMNDVKAVMCDGDQLFLAVQLPFGPVVAAQPSTADVDRGSYKYRAIYQKTGLAGSNDRQNLLYLEGGKTYSLVGQFQVAQIKSWRDQTVKDVAELTAIDKFYSPCKDNAYAQSYPSARTAMMSGVGSIIGNEYMQSCDDIAHLCYNDTSLAGKTARLICPNTCGMSSNSGKALGGTDMMARSGLFLDTTGDGIPVACLHGFALSLQSIHPCADPSLGELLSNSAWKRYADGFSAYWIPVFTEMSTVNHTLNLSHFNFLRNYLWEGMSIKGCNFFSHPIMFPSLPIGSTGINFCDPNEYPLQGRRSMRPFCPVTCGCNTYVRGHYAFMKNMGVLVAVGESQCPQRCLD